MIESEWLRCVEVVVNSFRPEMDRRGGFRQSEVGVLEGLLPEGEEGVPLFQLELLSRRKGPAERLVRYQREPQTDK